MYMNTCEPAESVKEFQSCYDNRINIGEYSNTVKPPHMQFIDIASETREALEECLNILSRLRVLLIGPEDVAPCGNKREINCLYDEVFANMDMAQTLRGLLTEVSCILGSDGSR